MKLKGKIFGDRVQRVLPNLTCKTNKSLVLQGDRPFKSYARVDFCRLTRLIIIDIK